MTLNIADDFESIVDNLDAVVFTALDDQAFNVNAASQPVRHHEASNSGGQYTTEDRVFLFSQAGVGQPPDVGSKINDGTDWTVLSSRTDRLTNRFRCVCRSSSVIGTVTIQTASFNQDDNGIQETTWTDSLTDVPATVIQDSSQTETEHQVEKLKPRVQVVFLSPQTLSKNHRIVSGSQVFRIMGLDDVENLADLYSVQAEEW